MLQFIRIAARNLTKHRTRTLIIGGAIASVTVMLVMLMALTAGIRRTILNNATALASGHVNIGGFYKISQTSANPLVTNYPPILDLARKSVPEASLFYDRLKGFGKIISDTGSITVPVWGVDYDNERSVIGHLPAIEGNPADLAKPGNLVMFATHAKKLQVKVGDTVTVSMPTYRNIYNTKDVRVAAILTDMGLMSSFSLFLNKEDLREVYQLPKDATGVIMIFLKDVKDVPVVEERLRRVLAENKHLLMDREPVAYWMKFDRVSGESWTGQKLDISTWEDETSYAKWVLDLLGALTFVFTFVLMIIVVLGLLNTLWMAIRERTSEIGTLRAIGLQRRQVLLMFFLEALILSVCSILTGIVVGSALSGLLNLLHVPVQSEAFQMFLMSNELTLHLKGGNLIMTFFLISFFLVLGALIPSYQASKMKPITAINHVGGLALALLSASWLIAPSTQAAPLNPTEALDLVKLVDERQQNSGDYTSLVYIKETERSKEPRVYQAVVYRRDKDNKFMILITKPKEESGKGYLKIDKNLWMYDPNTGKWERRTERERIAGTNSRRADFDESRLAVEFTVTYDGEGTLGDYKTHKLKLKVKDGIDAAYPLINLTVDQKDKNILKREELSLSGKLMRVTYYPKWKKMFSASKNGDVWIPEEMRIFDELEKGNSTIILIKETDLKAVDSSIFTKAWIESKSK